jgi:hypothetical protein
MYDRDVVDELPTNFDPQYPESSDVIRPSYPRLPNLHVPIPPYPYTAQHQKIPRGLNFSK